MTKTATLLMFISFSVVVMASCGKDKTTPAAPAATPVPTSTPTACSTHLPGGILVTDTPSLVNTNTIHAFPVTLSATGSINRVRLRLTTNVVTTAAVAIYTNTTSGQPGIRLAQGVTRVLDPVSASSFNIQTPSLAADIYWVAYIFTGDAPTLQTVTLVGRRFYSLGPHSEFPAVMPSGSIHASNVSMYSYVCD